MAPWQFAQFLANTWNPLLTLYCIKISFINTIERQNAYLPESYVPKNLFWGQLTCP